MRIIILSLLIIGGLAAHAQTKPVDHIEVHGQTGIGDTAIVHFKDGGTERYVLNNPSEKEKFDRVYGTLLSQQGPDKKGRGESAPREDDRLVRNEPLNPIPENISEITFGEKAIWLKLKNGTEERYDLTNEAEKKHF